MEQPPRRHLGPLGRLVWPHRPLGGIGMPWGMIGMAAQGLENSKPCCWFSGVPRRDFFFRKTNLTCVKTNAFPLIQNGENKS